MCLYASLILTSHETIIYSHHAGSSFLLYLILQENGLWGTVGGYCGSPQPCLAKSGKSKFGQKSIFFIFGRPNWAKNNKHVQTNLSQDYGLWYHLLVMKRCTCLVVLRRSVCLCLWCIRVWLCMSVSRVWFTICWFMNCFNYLNVDTTPCFDMLVLQFFMVVVLHVLDWFCCSVL